MTKEELWALLALRGQKSLQYNLFALQDRPTTLHSDLLSPFVLFIHQLIFDHAFASTGPKLKITLLS
jgi:hypothetical protein